MWQSLASAPKKDSEEKADSTRKVWKKHPKQNVEIKPSIKICFEIVNQTLNSN